MTNASAAALQQPQDDNADLHPDAADLAVASEDAKRHISAIEEGAIEDLDAETLLASLYYDAGTMSSLNPSAEAAISRLRDYKSAPFPIWDKLPPRKRAAVLLLLYADRWGDLRVVITMRAATLRSFSGHAALPGGKADYVEETPYQIARREASEEIGLPMDDDKLPKPFRIEHLCCLPPSLARTHLIVTPCVAFLHADRSNPGSPVPLVEDTMIPRLDAREVAAVFSAPFYNFLKLKDLPPPPGQELPPGHWYDGSWIAWKDKPWRVHNFYVPVNNQRVAKPRRRSSVSSAAAGQANLAGKLEEEEEEEGLARFKVWGMTARVLVDAARIAYGEEPEMEHNLHYGDEEIIHIAHAEGSFEDEPAKVKKAGEDGPSKI